MKKKDMVAIVKDLSTKQQRILLAVLADEADIMIEAMYGEYDSVISNRIYIATENNLNKGIVADKSILIQTDIMTG